MQDKSYYEGKNAVITGAASGFGLGITEQLLTRGAAGVWMGDYDDKQLAQEAARLETDFPGKVHYKHCDCTKKDDVFALIKNAAEEGEHLDFVFNNAGRPMTYPFTHLDISQFERLVQLNFLGVFYGTMAAVQIMEKQGYGHVVNTASCGGLLPAPYQAAYASTKAAVIAMTRSLDMEYADTNIRFTELSPMNVVSNIFKAQLLETMRAQGKSEAEIDNMVKDIKPPSNAMPMDEALDYIFAKLPNHEVDIIFGQDGRDAYKLMCTDYGAFKEKMSEVGAKRKKYYQAYFKGENPGPFPG